MSSPKGEGLVDDDFIHSRIKYALNNNDFLIPLYWRGGHRMVDGVVWNEDEVLHLVNVEINN
ncbi:MAG: hypothetical protein JJ895_09530 [Balneolaceae bacterium]|nr:hypothetical protein [Balneolaceae bacterium]